MMPYEIKETGLEKYTGMTINSKHVKNVKLKERFEIRQEVKGIESYKSEQRWDLGFEKWQEVEEQKREEGSELVVREKVEDEVFESEVSSRQEHSKLSEEELRSLRTSRKTKELFA